MNIEIIISFISIIYLYFITELKNKRKIQIFLSKNLNVLSILLLVIILYQINPNIGIILFILLLFTKYITNF